MAQVEALWRSGMPWLADNCMSLRWPIFTRGNIGEVFPQAVSPLGWDLGGHEAELGFRDSYIRLGMLSKRDFRSEGRFAVLSIFNGYAYLNVSLMRMLAIRVPGAKVEDFDRNLLGDLAAPAYVPRPGDRDLRCTVRLLLSVVRILGAREAPEIAESATIADDVQREAVAHSGSDDEQLQMMRMFARKFRRLMDLHITTSFKALAVAGIVAKLCAEAGEPELQVEITGGIVGDDLASAQPLHAMWALGRLAGRTPAVSAAFESGVNGLLQRLHGSAEAQEFLGHFHDLLHRFGYRGPNEWEITSRTWESHPTIALHAIDLMRRSPEERDPATIAASSRRRAQDAVARLQARLKPRQRRQLRKALRSIALYQRARESTKANNIRALNVARRAFMELAGRAAERGGAADPLDAAMLRMDEFADYVILPAPFMDTIRERRTRFDELAARVPAFVINGVVPPFDAAPLRETRATSIAFTQLLGIGGAPGVARGRARVVLDPGDPRGLEPGEILVAPITDPSWTPLFIPANAVVVEVGAILSHAVIVARELGIPCACSVADATTIIPDGVMIEVDGAKGTVRLIEV